MYIYTLWDLLLSLVLSWMAYNRETELNINVFSTSSSFVSSVSKR